ncbi:MAG: ATP-binding cassette domain-containing protein [Chloroflexi bacterium]|nr:ATP-binding cassette domain-containing protein [Chloroflexota bacterium]
MGCIKGGGILLAANVPAVVVENLSFRYQTRSERAIQDISFELWPGEILLVAGASGCGKTTLMRCINGLIPRSYKGDLHGRVLLHGQNTAGMRLADISRIVGTVLQDPEKQIMGSYVCDEVAFGLENLGWPREQIIATVEETLEYLRISHLRDRETFYLSGGEKQKVAIAGTLAMRPSILLLDEPLANLDPFSAREALDMIRRLADEGRTIIIIEHRVEDVLSIRPDKALLLEQGQQRYFGDLEGFARTVEYGEVKLPAPLVIEKAKGQKGMAIAPPVLETPTSKDEPLVLFEDVTFGYEEGTVALRDINLAIYPGDVVAILGPNGAGKTTLIKQAIGLLKPTAGRVVVAGQDTRQTSTAQLARTLGYVFQSPSHMLFAPTVREELAFGPRNLGYRAEDIQAGVAEAIRILNLSGLEDYSPLALSFGQQKRVSIAAILAMRSRILAMDEPTAGQDYRNYMEFMDSILQLPYFSAILFITHDLDLAICYANRVILMDNGRIVADGKPEETLSQPELLRECHLYPTSLLQTNLAMLGRTGRFMRAEALACLEANPSVDSSAFGLVG